MYSNHQFRYLLTGVLLLASTGLFAASVNFIKVEAFFVKPQQPVEVLPYSIILASTSRPFDKSAIKYLDDLKSDFIYLTEVTVNKKVYYRLVTGNFKTRKQAGLEVSRLKNYYPGAWVNTRTKVEQQQLDGLLNSTKNPQPAKKTAVPKIALKSNTPVTNQKSVQKITVPEITLKRKSSADANPAEKLLHQARQEFLDGNYTRVLAITNKVIEIGSIEQTQLAMELSGIARERQNKFTQAIAIYIDFLSLYPDSEMSVKIKNRLDGLKTMHLEPRGRINPDNRRSADSNWKIYGALSQYYRDDVIKLEKDDTEIVSSLLVTDINLFAEYKTDTSSLVMRFDGGLFRDIEDKETESRIGHALVSFNDRKSGYQLTAGRQQGTAKGVYSRFDGLVYKGLSHSSFSYSIYSGFPVQKSYDDAQSERQFIGTNVHLNPLAG